MKSREITNLLLKELGEQIDMKEIELDASGICAFTYRDRLDVVFELIESQNALVVYTPLLKSGAVPDRQLLQRCMQWNFLGQQTRGGVFSFNEHDESIYFQNYFKLAYVTMGGFLECVAEFLASITHFQEDLEGGGESASGPEAPALHEFVKFHA